MKNEIVDFERARARSLGHSLIAMYVAIRNSYFGRVIYLLVC
jgi:hypothetical protein